MSSFSVIFGGVDKVRMMVLYDEFGNLIRDEICETIEIKSVMDIQRKGLVRACGLCSVDHSIDGASVYTRHGQRYVVTDENTYHAQKSAKPGQSSGSLSI